MTFEEAKQALGIVTVAQIAAKCWTKIGHFIRLYKMGRSFMFQFCLINQQPVTLSLPVDVKSFADGIPHQGCQVQKNKKDQIWP
jgi:hypothetical protein